jgi:hypothetical protein
MRTKEEFMLRFKGVRANKVAAAFNALAVGTNYYGCSKGAMAEIWVDSEANPKGSNSRMHGFTLDQIEAELI